MTSSETTTITINCAGCGGDLTTTIDREGNVDACFGNVMEVKADRMVEDATPVDDYIEYEPQDGHHFGVWAECEECCPNCSDDTPDA